MKAIILHGWSYTIDKYEPFSRFLEEKGLKTILLKVPGLTEKLEIEKPWTINDYINWLKKIIDKEKGEVILIGHSNGGRISLNFAIKFPEKIKKLILIDSAGIYHNNLAIKIKKLIFGNLARIGKKITKSQVLKNLLYKLAREKDYKDAPEVMKKTMINLLSSDKFLDLTKVIAPTLIIWGENDQTLSVKDGKKMHESIKNSKLETIKDARHSPQFTHAEKVAEIIYEHL